METLAERTKRAKDELASVDSIKAREQAIVDRHASTAPLGSLARRTAEAKAELEIEARRNQRSVAEKAPPEIVAPTKEMLSNLGSRGNVLEVLRKMTPKQKAEALKIAPGIAQQLGDDRGGGVSRTLGAVSRGISHMVSQPTMELISSAARFSQKIPGQNTGAMQWLADMGGTPEEIEYIRQLDAAASQEFNPALPSDPWYERGPLQAVEMAPWMATIVGGGGLGRVGATGAAELVGTSAASGGKIAGAIQKTGQAIGTLPTKVPVVGKYLPGLTAGRAGELAGITASAFPGQYAQEVDQLKAIGMEDDAKLRLLAGGTAAVVGLIEGLVPNPMAGPVSLTQGAAKAARQYLWEAAKRAPAEMSEEYLQGVTSGLGQHVAQYIASEKEMDFNGDGNPVKYNPVERKSIADAFALGWEQTKEAALPMAFLLGVPASIGAGRAGLQARMYQEQLQPPLPGAVPPTATPNANGQLVDMGPAYTGPLDANGLPVQQTPEQQQEAAIAQSMAALDKPPGAHKWAEIVLGDRTRYKEAPDEATRTKEWQKSRSTATQGNTAPTETPPQSRPWWDFGSGVPEGEIPAPPGLALIDRLTGRSAQVPPAQPSASQVVPPPPPSQESTKVGEQVRFGSYTDVITSRGTENRIVEREGTVEKVHEDGTLTVRGGKETWRIDPSQIVARPGAQTPQETQATPETQPTGAPQAPSGSDAGAAVAGAGRGIVEGLYQSMFDRLQQNRYPGIAKTPADDAVAAEHARQPFQTPEEIRQFVNDGSRPVPQEQPSPTELTQDEAAKLIQERIAQRRAAQSQPETLSPIGDKTPTTEQTTAPVPQQPKGSDPDTQAEQVPPSPTPTVDRSSLINRKVEIEKELAGIDGLLDEREIAMYDELEGINKQLETLDAQSTTETPATVDRASPAAGTKFDAFVDSAWKAAGKSGPASDNYRKSQKQFVSSTADYGIQQGRVVAFDRGDGSTELQFAAIAEELEQRGYEAGPIEKSRSQGIDNIEFSVTRKSRSDIAPSQAESGSDTESIRKMLDDVNSRIASQGQVVDDRLLSRKRELERLLSDSGTVPSSQASPAGTAESEGTRATQGIGVNNQGQTVFEDENGVRSVQDGNVRVSESVTMRPTRGKGLVPVIDLAGRSDQFKTKDELKQQPDPDIETALGKFKKRLGVEVTATPTEKLTSEQQEVLDFATSRGQKMAFVSVPKTDKKVPIGTFYREEKVVLIREDVQGDKLWGTIGHEMAHSKGLDNILPADSAELKTMMDEYYQLASPEVQKRLMVNKRDHQREGRARMVQKFFEDKQFREELKKSNPTMWDKLREAVLKFIGQWTPKDEAKRLLLDELRTAPKPEKIKGPKQQKSLSQEKKPSDEDSAKVRAAGIKIDKTEKGWIVTGLPNDLSQEMQDGIEFEGGRRTSNGYFFKDNPTSRLVPTAEAIADENRKSNEAAKAGLVSTPIGILSQEDAEWYRGQRQQRLELAKQMLNDANAAVGELLGQFVPSAKRGLFKISLMKAAETGDPSNILRFDEMVDYSINHPELGLPQDESGLFDRLLQSVIQEKDLAKQIDDELATELASDNGDDSFKFGTQQTAIEGLEEDVARQERKDISDAKQAKSKKQFELDNSKGTQKTFLTDIYGDPSQGTLFDPDGTAEADQPKPKSSRGGGAIMAVMTADGTIYSDPEAATHYDVVEKFGLDSSEIIDGGFIIDGKYKMAMSDGGYAATEGDDEQVATVKRYADEYNAKKTSADQVNVDSGAESKVKPESTESDFDAEMEKLMSGLDKPESGLTKPEPTKRTARKPSSEKKPSTPRTPKTPEQKSADDRARAAAKKAEAKRKMREAFEETQNKPTTLFNPQVGVKVAQATKLYIEAGALDFRAFIRDLVTDFGKPWVAEKAQYLESAWRTANKLKWIDSPTGNVTDVLAEIQEEPESLYTVEGEEGMIARVFDHEDGFSVNVTDTDSGLSGDQVRIFPTLQQAKDYADTIKAKENSDDTTRNDDSEAVGEDTSKPDSKPKTRGKTRKGARGNKPKDTGDRGDDEGAGSGSTEDSGGNRDGVSSPAGSLNNHRIGEHPDWLDGGPVVKLNRNIDAITTMNRIESEGRRATTEEQSVIAKYTGWGHLKQFFIRDSDLRAIRAVQGDKWNLNAFNALDARTEEMIRDQGKRKGDSEEKIEAKIQREKANNKHRVRLATSMTPAEYALARKSTRYSHYTDPAIARAMWGVLADALPEAGKIRILEPSEGSGMFWGTMPESMFNRAEMHGIDMDPASSRVAKHLYPSARHLNIPFQESPYPEGFFDLAITNVPFNKNPVQDPNANFGELSLHNYFFAKTAGRLREGGVVAFITTHFTMDAVSPTQRIAISDQGLKFLGAVRLNQDAFGNVANTKVVTDIIIMQKVDPAKIDKSSGFDNNGFNRGAQTILIPNPQPGEPNARAELNLHPYFTTKASEKIAGQITAAGSMRGPEPELTVESSMTPEETAEFISRSLAKVAVDKQAFIDGQQHRQDMNQMTEGSTTFVPEHLQNLGVGRLAVDGTNLVVRTSEETMSIVKTDFSPTLKARADGWFAIRDALLNLQQLQVRPDNPESEIESARKELNRVYDEFVGEFNEKKNDYTGYKPLNTTYNKSMFAADYTSATVQALENTKLVPTGELDKDGKEKTRLRVEKASIFTERTEWPLEHRPKPKSVKEALAHSMFTNGGVDIDWIATTLDKSKDEVAKQLEKYAFELPNEGGWEINEVYLSGNIAKKLEIAEDAAQKNPAFTRNVDSLREVLPVPKTFEQLKIYPNSPFLPVDLLRSFVSEVLGLGSFDLYRNDQDLGGGWRANYDKNDQSNRTTQDTEQYAVRTGDRLRRRGFELFLDMIAGKPTIIVDRDADDNTYVNEAATNLAKTKRMDLSRAFDTFVRSSQERMDAVTNEFNRLLSGYVKPSVPDWVVSFDGMSSNWKDLMRSYQKEAAAKIAMGGNTLLAHRVGYGKTLSGVAGVMEQRRLGVARKPIVVVPNHLTGQWAKAFADFYPSAKIMAPTANDFDKNNRQATMNRIMTGNWDAVIIPESSFKKLPMSSEYVEQFFQQQIAQSIDAAERARAEEGADPRSIAELEDVTERLRNQLKKYLAESQKDSGPFFDEMGIDSLTVDEAHHYKNLPFYTQNTRVAGINPTGSQQAFDMLMKTDFINTLTGSRNVTFLTGTPIANSMTEAWVMMRYLMPETLKESNVFAFDDWKNAFGEVVDRTRVNTIGTGFRTETRFQQFVNLDVLAKMFQQVADIQMVNNDVQVPPLSGGKPRSIVVPASDAMKNFMLGLAARSANMPKDNAEDNMLNVMTVGAGAAIDFRLLDAAALPSETNKITVAADEVARVFHLTTPFKGTQIIWADRGVPKAAKKLTAEMKQLGAWMLEEIQSRPLTMEDVKEKWKELRPTKNSAAELQRFMGMALQDMNYTTGSEEDEASYKVDPEDEPTVWINEITDVDPNITEQAAPPWNVYQQMKTELVARGIPENQIAFIHDYKTAAQKVQLWEKMNNGDMRVLLGNTPRLGTGANIQQRLVAAHHLDAPWKPSDVEQRDGRIIRSGNRVMTIGDKIGYAEQTGVKLDGVMINRYVTEGSIDARYWDTNEMKAQMLQDFWSGNPGVSIEELGATTLSMSDVKAAAVANPLLKRKIELEHEVGKLSEEYRGAVQSRTQAVSRLRDARDEVPEAKKKLEAAKKRAEWWEAGKASLPEGEAFGIEIDGEMLFRRDDIAKAIDKKLHEAGRNVPLKSVKKDDSEWSRNKGANSSDAIPIGKVFGKTVTAVVEGGFRNPETGEVVGGNTWQQNRLEKELKAGTWERSYGNAVFRVAGIEGLAQLGTTPQGFSARIRNFSDPGDAWVANHEKALASKEKSLAELEKLVQSIPEPDSATLIEKQQELEEVSNAIGEEDDDQITYWVATEELEKTLGEFTLREQLGRVDSGEYLLGYIDHPKDGRLSVFNRAGETRPPAHAMVWVEGNNATIGYVPRDEKGVMGLPILKPRKKIGYINHPEHGELLIFNHKEGDVVQQGKVWVENEDGKSYGYQDKSLNVVMGVEMNKLEAWGQWPEDVKQKTDPLPARKTDSSKSPRSGSGNSLNEFTSPELQNRQSMGAAKVVIASAADLVGEEDAGSNSQYASPDGEFERRWQQATNGIGKKTLATKLREFWNELVKSTVRGSLPELPRTKQFGEARSAMHAYQNAPTYAQLATADLLKKTTKPLSAKDYDLFTRIVIMRDQVEAADRGERLSYGLTPAKAKAELDRLEALAEKNERVQASLEYRRQWTEAMVDDFLSAHEYLGLDMSDRFKRENYFRHQVLYYMEAQQRGLGKKKVELTPNRGWLKGRTSGEDLGEDFDINANYLQAEWEVSTQMIADTKRAQAIGRLKRHYDKMRQLKEEAKYNNYVAVVGGQDVMDEIEELRGRMEEMRAQGSLDSGEKAQMKAWSERLWELDPTMPFRRDMAIAKDKIERGASNLGEEVPDEFVRYAKSLAERDGHPLQTLALKFLKAMSDRKAFIKNALGDDYQTWEDVVPDDHEEVAIRPGRAMFQAYSVSEQVASELMADLSTTLGISAEDLRPITAMGSKYTPLVVPQEVAAQMMAVDNKMDFGWLDRIVTKPMNAWKRWVLMAPTRILKYNLRNLSEVDKVMALNPAALREVPQAIQDLWKLYSGADEIPSNVRDWVERGGTTTLVQVNELGEVNELKEFAKLVSDKKSGIVGKLVKSPIDAWKKYWSVANISSNFRESILRYAAYLSYIKQLEAGKLTNYGGSVRAEVDGIKDNKDKAMRLSADLLGDYSDISLVGQFMRSRIAPFWSFQETNVRTYFRGLMNLASNEQSAIKAGMKIARAAGFAGLAKTPFLAYKLGRIAILFYGLQAMATAFNQLLFPDDDDDLPEDEKRRAHLTFGKNSNGEVQYFSRIGTAADVLDWIGLDSVDYDLRDVLDGRRTVRDIMNDMVRSPVDKAYGMLSPFMKAPAELAVGQTAYPQVGKPRPIRDRAEYIAKNLGIEKEYDKLVGNPSTPYAISDLVLYKVEPGTSVYYMTLDAKSRWLKTARNRGVGYSESARGNAMRNYKMALRLNDKVAADKYLAEFTAAGGTKDGMLDSLESSHPAGGLSTVDSILFYNELEPVEKDEYRRAEQFYYSELLTEEQATAIRTRREKRIKDLASAKNKDGSPKGKPEKTADETAEEFRDRLKKWQDERKLAQEFLRAQSAIDLRNQ